MLAPLGTSLVAAAPPAGQVHCITQQLYNTAMKLLILMQCKYAMLHVRIGPSQQPFCD